jgi:hypothetical protein
MWRGSGAPDKKPADVLTLLIAEKGLLAGTGVLPGAIRAAGGGDSAGHSLVGEDEFEERLRSSFNAEVTQGFQVLLRGGVANEATTAQGAHHDIASTLLTLRSSTNVPPISRAPSTRRTALSLSIFRVYAAVPSRS